jgi:hypothetical protein
MLLTRWQREGLCVYLYVRVADDDKEA